MKSREPFERWPNRNAPFCCGELASRSRRNDGWVRHPPHGLEKTDHVWEGKRKTRGGCNLIPKCYTNKNHSLIEQILQLIASTLSETVVTLIRTDMFTACTAPRHTDKNRYCFRTCTASTSDKRLLHLVSSKNSLIKTSNPNWLRVRDV